MSYRFTVPGQPQGKGRPRFAVNGGYARAYTPERTASYENLVKLSYQREYGQTMTAGALKMAIRAYYTMPSSWSKKRRLAALNREIYPVVKPDMDNIVKVICDALNGIAYLDDKQIVSLEMYKRYDVAPRVEVLIEEVNIEPEYGAVL